GIPEQDATLANGQARWPLGERALEERLARRPEAGRERARAAEQRAVQRVHVGVDGGTDEAVPLARRERLRPAARGAGALPQVLQLGGRRALLRDHEEPPPARALAQARAAGVDREWHREDQRPDDRRHPPEVARAQPEETG